MQARARRGAGAAERDIRGAAGHQQFAQQARTSLWALTFGNISELSRATPRTPALCRIHDGNRRDHRRSDGGQFGDHLFLVINAACKAGDIVHLRTHLSDVCDVDVLEERVLVALQGPLAADALAKISPTTVAMRFMDAGCHVVAGVPCLVSRSGYTGEDGYELSIPADRAVELEHSALRVGHILRV